VPPLARQPLEQHLYFLTHRLGRCFDQRVEVVVKKFVALCAGELKKKAWDSIGQLVFGGAVIYLISVIGGPLYGCGAGNTQLMDGMFSCARGEMQSVYKLLIIAGIVVASLCWGRAACLYEKRHMAE